MARLLFVEVCHEVVQARKVSWCFGVRHVALAVGLFWGRCSAWRLKRPITCIMYPRFSSGAWIVCWLCDGGQRFHVYTHGVAGWAVFRDKQKSATRNRGVYIYGYLRLLSAPHVNATCCSAVHPLLSISFSSVMLLLFVLPSAR